MFEKDRWIEVFQVLSKNPLRTFATAFGVVWGIMMLIIMIGSGRGLENGFMTDFDRVTNCMFVWSQSTTKPYAGFKKGRSFELNYDDVEYLVQNVTEIDLISPRLQLGGYGGSTEVVNGVRTGSYAVFGETPNTQLIELIPMKEGRFLNWDDLKHVRKVCVIGDRVYKDLFPKGANPLGEYIEIGGINTQVIGVYKSKSKAEADDGDTKQIYIPITLAQIIGNTGNDIGWLSITSDEDVLVSEMQEKIITALKIRHKVHPDDTRAFGAHNRERQFLQITGIFNGIRGLSWFVGVLTLFAGIIGVSNIMLVIIKERTKEIGVRKALGATPWNIISQIVLESFFLASISGFVGAILGVWLLEGVGVAIEGSEGSFRNPGVDFNVLFWALIILILSGVLAGLLPSIRAARIKPVEALRSE